MGGFGVAIVEVDRPPGTATVDFADQAVSFVCERVAGPPAGAGVDAPLWWSSGRSSDRHADRWLRQRYGLQSGHVQTANSLQGAALVQAAMFVQRLREAFPAIPITEVHPKALLAVTKGGWQTLAEQYAITATPNTEHERDAILAALAAREGFEGRWPLDLAAERLPAEQDPSTYWLAPVHYYWPGA
jgi:predicted nuclease with RNAse H fold